MQILRVDSWVSGCIRCLLGPWEFVNSVECDASFSHIETLFWGTLCSFTLELLTAIYFDLNSAHQYLPMFLCHGYTSIFSPLFFCVKDQVKRGHWRFHNLSTLVPFLGSPRGFHSLEVLWCKYKNLVYLKERVQN